MKSLTKRKSPPSFTLEHRSKIGAFWKGVKRSPETRAKMSAAQKGKIISPETIFKISKTKIGTHHTLETRKKISDANKGDKNYFWKGGKMKNYLESEQIRKSIEYDLWRNSCFARDGYTCQCDGMKGKLIVHHIFNFADYSELRLAIDNGITLCEKCHKDFHKTYGKNKNNNEQLIEFLNNKKYES